MNEQLTASDRCFSCIRDWETFRLAPYVCPAGVWTQGYGHTRGIGPSSPACDVATAMAWLRSDVAIEEQALRKVFAGVQLTQGQWDALVSLSFNMKGGAASLPHKAPKLVAAIRARDFTAAAREFIDINKANGKPLAGLTKRRQQEAAMFMA